MDEQRTMAEELERVRKINAEMLAALEQAYEALGKEQRWIISTLRLDVIRPAIKHAKEQ